MESQKRILFVATVAQTINAFLLPYAQYLRHKGWRVDALSSNVHDYKEFDGHFDKVWNVNFSRNPFALQHLFSIPQKLRQIVEQENYHCVHVHSPVAAFWTRFSLRKMHSPRPRIIYTAHGFHFHQQGNPISNALFLGAEKLAGQWTDRLVVINREDEYAAKKFRLVPRKNLTFVPGTGVDLSYYSESKVSTEEVLAFRHSLHLGPEDKIFLLIAEFTPQKNHKLIIQAASQLQDPSIHFVFAGAGKTFSAIKKMAEDYQLQDRIHFLGFRKDIPVLIQAATAVLLVSAREGLPRSLMEAMSFKKPLIGTNIRGIRELLRKNCGLLIPNNSTEDLIKAIRTILDNPVAAKTMGNNAFKRVAIHDINLILKYYEEIYESA